MVQAQVPEQDREAVQEAESLKEASSHDQRLQSPDMGNHPHHGRSSDYFFGISHTDAIGGITIEQRICPKCSKPAYSSVFVGAWECPNCGEEVKVNREEVKDKMQGLNMTFSVTAIKEVKEVIGSAVELEKLIEKCVYKSQIDNSVEYYNFKSALDGLAKLAEDKLKPMDEYGPLSSQEITALHLDGTLCNQCGTYLGEATGEPRLCKGCEY